eukprot:XP_028343093.1 tRNA selenocysteine 1-associated protein 1 isoform X2 [Physeter catodon]
MFSPSVSASGLLSRSCCKCHFRRRIPAGYCFVEFADLATAEKCLHKINGKPLPGATPAKRFKLNYATYGKQPDNSPEYSLFVGDLTPDVDDGMLYEFFVKVYPSCRGGKVVLDQTGVSKGYGFVKFTDELEQKRALTECQGAVGLGSKPVRLSVAIPKASRVKPVEYSQMYSYSYNQYYQQYQNYYAQWGYDQNTGSYSYSYPQYGYTQSTMQTYEEVGDDALEGVEPAPLAVKAWSPNHWTAREFRNTSHFNLIATQRWGTTGIVILLHLCLGSTAHPPGPVFRVRKGALLPHATAGCDRGQQGVHGAERGAI